MIVCLIFLSGHWRTIKIGIVLYFDKDFQEGIKLPNPFISFFSTRDLFKKMEETERLWEDFITASKKNTELKIHVRNDILDSWNRCQLRGVNPRMSQANPSLSDLELKQLLTKSELYRVAKPIIDSIFHKLIGTGYLITLNNEDGKMIYLKGDPDVIKKTKNMNFSTGMDWSESAAGTNAIGTSIATKKPIQIFAAEHFCEGFHPMTCSSAPIFKPYTNQVIGAIDFTGLWQNGQPHTLGLAVSLARLIEQEISNLYKDKYDYLTEFYYKSIFGSKEDFTLILSTDFIVINCSEILMEVFNLKKMMDLSTHPQFHALVNDLKGHGINTQHLPYFLSNDEFPRFKVNEIEIIHYKDEAIGFMIIITDTSFRNTNAPTVLGKQQPHQVVGESAAFVNVLRKCKKGAKTNAPTLLLGETGTGKEVIARLIHQESSRAHKPFIAINCGAIQKELIGSELFGYESGTFTGGVKEGKKGKFEEANGGTLFLDEIGEMPLDLQTHLLRVLQEKEVTRLGSSKTINVDVRIIAATNKNLYTMIENGLFRRDLFFRLNVVSVEIPALQDRKEDIPLLSDHFIKKFCGQYKKNLPYFLTDETLALFMQYNWPGNIRELQNVLEHAVIFSNSPAIERKHLPDYLLSTNDTEQINEENGVTLSIMEYEEKKKILELLDHTKGNLSAVSRELNIARSTLYRKLKKYQLII